MELNIDEWTQKKLEMLFALAMGPITFILKHSAQGFIKLDDELTPRLAESCWDAIRK